MFTKAVFADFHAKSAFCLFFRTIVDASTFVRVILYINKKIQLPGKLYKHALLGNDLPARYASIGRGAHGTAG
jgi:hypothetical protein